MRRLALGLAVLSLVLAPAAPTLAADQPPKLLGWTADNAPPALPNQAATLDLVEDLTGKYPAFIQLYWSVEGAWASGAALDLYAQRGVVPYVELTAENLSKVTAATLAPKVAALMDWLDQSPRASW